MRNRRRVSLAAVALLTVAVAAAVVASAGNDGSHEVLRPIVTNRQAPRITGWLHTDGTRIVGRAGQTVRLLGLDEPSLISGSGNNRITEPDACGEGWLPIAASEYTRFRQFGFNSVRLGISWANLEPSPPTVAAGRVEHHWNRPYLMALDSAVHGFTSHGIAVILDMHQANTSPAFARPRPNRCEGTGLPAWLFPNAGAISAHQGQCDFLLNRAEPGVSVAPQSGYEDAWRLIALRYARNPLVVAADMYNEPGYCTGEDLEAFYSTIGAAIRAVAPHLLLIYQDRAARGGVFVVDRPLRMRNTVYSFHVYANQWSQAENTIAMHISHSASWRVPIWIGEFGVQVSHSSRQATSAQLMAWPNVMIPLVAYAKAHDLGWAFHQYSGGSTALIPKSSGRLRSGWLTDLRSGF